jgi:hypothetical protein
MTLPRGAQLVGQGLALRRPLRPPLEFGISSVRMSRIFRYHVF